MDLGIVLLAEKDSMFSTNFLQYLELLEEEKVGKGTIL
jgi:hypothetical protein